jgi:hypothetical protein
MYRESDGGGVSLLITDITLKKKAERRLNVLAQVRVLFLFLSHVPVHICSVQQSDNHLCYVRERHHQVGRLLSVSVNTDLPSLFVSVLDVVGTVTFTVCSFVGGRTMISRGIVAECPQMCCFSFNVSCGKR